jgi:hypothetical protein
MAPSDLQSYEIEEVTPEMIEEAPAEEEAYLDFEEPVEVIEEIERGLGFTDGFQFGCGFWVSALVVAIIAALAFLILTFFLSFAGINLLG